MKVLALDLTGVTGSLAIVDDGACLIEELITSTDGYGHVLFQRLSEMLVRAGIELAQIDCYASASGPGSFTGVRVGLAAVKGLAEATGKPAIGISTLRAIAAAGDAPLRAPVIDARRGDIFAALFRNEANRLVETLPETVGPPNVFLASLAELGACQFITPHAAWLRALLPESSSVLESPPALATAVARCALIDMRSGINGDPARLDANYVRRSDAEFFWQDRNFTQSPANTK